MNGLDETQTSTLETEAEGADTEIFLTRRRITIANDLSDECHVATRDLEDSIAAFETILPTADY